MDIELYVDKIELTAVALPKLELEGGRLKRIYEPFECALKGRTEAVLEEM